MNWNIVYYQTASGNEPVKEFINKLTNKKQAKVVWMLQLLKQHGKSLPKQYLKYLAKTRYLWELKVGIYRIFLSFLEKKNILLIHTIVKKTQKIPKKDIKLSIKRLKPYL